MLLWLRLNMICWQVNDNTDIFLNQMIQCYWNNMINLHSLPAHISHTHKMAIALWPQIMWRHFTLTCLFWPATFAWSLCALPSKCTSAFSASSVRDLPQLQRRWRSCFRLRKTCSRWRRRTHETHHSCPVWSFRSSITDNLQIYNFNVIFHYSTALKHCQYTRIDMAVLYVFVVTA